MSLEGRLQIEPAALDKDGDTSVTRGYRIVVHGEIDMTTAPQLEAALEGFIAQGATLLVLDASGIEFIDSSGLRVIVKIGNELKASGGRLLIDGLSGAVTRVLEVSGLIEQYRS